MSPEGKRVGIFTAYHAEAIQGWTDRATGFILRPGDTYLDVNIEKFGRHIRTDVTNSMRALADYILQSPDQPEIISSFTYGRIARLSKRFGFLVADTDIPDDVKKKELSYREEYEEKYKGFNGKIPQEVILIYQRKDDVLLKYGNTL